METTEQIWKEYHDQLFRFINKQVNDEMQAEDILQDVFIKILTKIDTLKDRSKLKSWIYQLTRNAIIDHYRLKKSTSDIDSFSIISETQVDMEAMHEATNWIGRFIEALPESYRQALVLYEMEGLAQKEIAELLNISYVNTRLRIQRGRKLLKKNLSDCCEFNVDTYGNILEYKKKRGAKK